MKIWKLSIYIVLILFLVGCQKSTYQGISNEESFVATLNIQDFTLDYLSSTGEQLAHWDLKKSYTGAHLSEDGQNILLFGTEIATVDIFSLEKGRLVDTIKTGPGITALHYIPSLKMWALSDKKKSAIRFLDQQGKELHSVAVSEYPIAMASNDKTLFVTTFKGADLFAIDLETYRISNNVKIPASTAGLLIRENQNELWIGGHGKGSQAQQYISIYSTETLELIEQVDAPLMPVDFLETADGVYSISHGTNRLIHFNDEKLEQGSLEVGANPFAIQQIKGQIVVAGYDDSQVFWIEPGTLEISRKIQVGNGPFIMLVRER